MATKIIGVGTPENVTRVLENIRLGSGRLKGQRENNRPYVMPWFHRSKRDSSN